MHPRYCANQYYPKYLSHLKKFVNNGDMQFRSLVIVKKNFVAEIGKRQLKTKLGIIQIIRPM